MGSVVTSQTTKRGRPTVRRRACRGRIYGLYSGGGLSSTIVIENSEGSGNNLVCSRGQLSCFEDNMRSRLGKQVLKISFWYVQSLITSICLQALRVSMSQSQHSLAILTMLTMLTMLTV